MTVSNTARKPRTSKFIRHRTFFVVFMSLGSLCAFVTAIMLFTRAGIYYTTTTWRFDNLFLLPGTLALASMVVAAMGARFPASWSRPAVGTVGTILWLLIIAGIVLFGYRYPMRAVITQYSHLAGQQGLLEEKALILGISHSTLRGASHSYQLTQLDQGFFDTGPLMECLSAERAWFAGAMYMHTWNVPSRGLGLSKENRGNAHCHELDKNALLTGPYRDGKDTRTVPGFTPEKTDGRS